MKSMQSKYKQHLRSAKSRSIHSYLTFSDFWSLKYSDCFYCNIPHDFLLRYCEYMNVGTPWMTLDRKNNSVGYTKENTVSCCFLCNKTKGSLFNAQEFYEIAQQYIKPKWLTWQTQVDEDFDEWCQLNVNLPGEEDL